MFFVFLGLALSDLLFLALWIALGFRVHGDPALAFTAPALSAELAPDVRSSEAEAVAKGNGDGSLFQSHTLAHVRLPEYEAPLVEINHVASRGAAEAECPALHG